MTNFFVIISDLGHGTLYILICLACLLLSWFMQERAAKGFKTLAWRMSAFWVWGVLINTALKYLILSPRPWYIDGALPPLHPSPSGGYGMPSGHTQSAVGIFFFCWSMIQLGQKAAKFGDKKLFGLGLGLSWVILIASSRVYLNAHSLAQVIMGASVGFALMALILWIESRSNGIFLGLVVLVTSLGACLWRIAHPNLLAQELLSRALEFGVNITVAPRLSLVIISFSLSGLLLWLRHRSHLKLA